jgi:hypothetical protein
MRSGPYTHKVARKLVLCVIDGLTPASLERALENGRLPALSYLAANGEYRRGVSVFPSVTPVCLSAIATGGGPDVHGIPHIVWWNAAERRVVEYGSSLGAVLAAGLGGAMRDAVLNMSAEHLSPAATTVFEAVEDAGLVAGAISFTCYRGRARHSIRLPDLARRNRWYEAVNAPSRFFFFNLYESDETGAPLAIRSRVAGSVDRYAAHVGRWLVTRDGFDFLVYYLPDYDHASHAAGPDAAELALERADAALLELAGAAGGLDDFLERYAIVVCSDHGQTRVNRVVRLQEHFADLALLSARRPRPERADVAVCPSNRAAMIYRLPGCELPARALAERLDEDQAVDVVLFREDGVAVARRERAELRFTPARGSFRLEGDAGVLDPARYPNGLERAWASVACERSGDVLVSAAEEYEFADLGGRHHAGGGSHGSLLAGDSLVPVLACGLDLPLPAEPRITDLKGLALGHLRIEPGAPVAEAAGAV